MGSRFVVALSLVLAVSGQAVADDTAPANLAMRSQAPTEVVSVPPGRRVLATALAVLPGVLVRGTGSYLVHDKRSAKRLLQIAGIGLGLVALGGIPIQLSGASPYAVVPFVPMVVSGAGLIVQSWIADVYHAAGGSDEGHARARVPWSLELATVWSHEAYRERGLVHVVGTAAYDRATLSAGVWRNVDGAYYAGDATVAVRLLGAQQHDGGLLRSGSFLEVRATGRLRDDRDDRVQVATIEGELAGRLDLSQVYGQLSGMYAELSTGGGGERAAYATADQWDSILLGRFAWGAYIGARGEAQLFYDHRRDSLAGGIAASRAAGFVGSVGAALDLRLTDRLAVHGELEIGSAWVSTIGLRVFGGQP